MRITFTALLLAALLANSTNARDDVSAESENFAVRSFPGGPAAGEVLAECRRLRGELHDLLFGETAPPAWRPRCEVVLHADRRGYLAAVGRGGAQTMGSSLTQMSAGRLVRRRIDLLTDEQQSAPALAHELTHVVLAARFGGPPPRWADEGLALLADSSHKQTLHHRDLAHALRTGTTLRMGELIALQQPRSPEQVGVFYGQSLSLVRFLLERDDSRRFADFLETVRSHGYDRALRAAYDIDGVVHLERLWRRHAETQAARPRVIPVSRITSGD